MPTRSRPLAAAAKSSYTGDIMDPFITPALAATLLGTLGQIGAGQEQAKKQKQANEATAAVRGAERQRQDAYGAESSGIARGAIGKFTPGGWTAQQDAEIAKRSPVWQDNAEGAQFGQDTIAGQGGAPSLVAEHLSKQLAGSRERGRNNARLKANLAGAEALDDNVKIDAAQTANMLAAIRDWSGASQSLLPGEQQIAGHVQADNDILPDLLVGGGQLGLMAGGMGFGDKLKGVLGGLQAPVFDRVMGGRGY